MRVVVTRIEPDGTMRRRVVNTAGRDDGPRWEDLAARALAFRPPYRPIPGTAVYHVSVDDHLVQVGEYDLDGPLRDLVTVVLAMGQEIWRARAEATPAFPVEAGDGQIVGLVTVHRVNQVPAAERGRTALRDAACPLSDVARATPDEPVADVLPRLNACSENRALVFADGHLAGIVSPADISRAVERLGRGPGTLASARN